MATDASLRARTGARIRARRQILDMTQQELADALGVDRASVAGWESGKHYPLRKLGAIEHVLGVSLGGDDAGPVIIPPSLRRMIERLTPEERDWVLAELTRPPADDPAADGHPRRAGGLAAP
jgi:transcriptional regulator with XRE-family HTH domain